MSTLSIQVVISVNAAEKPAEQAVEYVQEVVAGLTSGHAATPVVVSAPIFGLEKQLGRLLDHNPVFARRVRTVHDELVKLGFVPTLPKSKKDLLPSYISYIDPGTGLNFGNLNSEKFYVMRGYLKGELEKLEHFGSDSRYAHCHLVNDEAVNALLKIAQREKR